MSTVLKDDSGASEWTEHHQGLGNPPEGCHPNIRAAMDYWLSIHPERGLPGRQHLDPRDIPTLLPYIRLLDVCGQPPRIKARLLGTKLVEFLGRDYTGQWLDQVYPDFEGSAMQRSYLHVITTKQPEWRIGKPYLSHHKMLHKIERIILPLARDAENVDMMVCVFVFHGVEWTADIHRHPYPPVRP